MPLGPGFTFVGYTGGATALADLLAGLDGVRAAFRFDAELQGYDTFRSGRPPFLSTFSKVERMEGIFLLNEGPSTTLTWEQVVGGAPPRGVAFSDFADVSGLILAGSTAVAISDGLPVLRLPDANSQMGTAFTRTPIALRADGSFQSTFSFQFGSPGGATDLADGVQEADSFVFVLQTQGSVDQAGKTGHRLGYEGLSPSVGVEFDTWANGAIDGDDGNHVGINLDGKHHLRRARGDHAGAQ